MRRGDVTFMRIAGACGVAAAVTSTLGWLVGGLLQPAGYSALDDDISQLGAQTASSPWLYNQVSSNLSGLLVVVVGVALWRAVSPDTLGRLGALVLMVAGTGAFLDGLFRLDCQGAVDPQCVNDSWHSHAHRIESAVTATAIIVAPIVLALAFRRLRHWRDTWIPTLLAIPAGLLAGAVFSLLGDGAATRATTLTWFVWLAYVGFQLSRKAHRTRPDLGERARAAPA